MEYARFRDGFARRRSPRSQWEVIDHIPPERLKELEEQERIDARIAEFGYDPGEPEPVDEDVDNAPRNESAVAEDSEPAVGVPEAVLEELEEAGSEPEDGEQEAS